MQQALLYFCLLSFESKLTQSLLLLFNVSLISVDKLTIMTKTFFTNTLAALFIILFPAGWLHSQSCVVDKESIKGTYTGDCKKGKAHGKGKSIGSDTYEGDFKNGLPDGQGTYTWANKNFFTGKFVKGLRDGKGIMTFKTEGGQDSLVAGFWKKDIYIGKNERPWLVHSKTGSVRSVDVEYTPDNVNRVKIIITTTTGGVPSIGGILPRASASNIVVIKGNYERSTTLETHYKSTETSLMEVVFPLHIKFNIGSEQVEVEFFEQGSYTVTVSVNQ
jgi:hypothetical protein